MESGTYLDKNDMMWVCNQTDGTVAPHIVDTANNTLNESLDTNPESSGSGLLYRRAAPGADPWFHHGRGRRYVSLG